MKKIIIIFFLTLTTHHFSQEIPNGFLEIREIIPDIVLDLRYQTTHNFLGVKVDGYIAEKCYITKAAADSLSKVQAELRKFNLTLKVYDAYRPQRAVNHFVRWANNLGDTLTKKEFYPSVNKSRLFLDGYIAEKSGHSRGSTIDLTIVPIPFSEQPEYDVNNQCECYKPIEERFKDNSIDMGTGFDCFSVLSHTENPDISSQQRVNRLLLVSLMEKYGFKNLPEEWWHFTLRNEPFPKTYFDFEIN
jgi:zinc D-Ala-D-Ala dipeptidase